MQESYALELLQLTVKRKEAQQELRKEIQTADKKLEPIQTRIKLIEKELSELIGKL